LEEKVNREKKRRGFEGLVEIDRRLKVF